MQESTLNIDLQLLWIDRWTWSFLLNGISLFLAYAFPFLTAQGSIHAGILGMVIWGSLGWRGWIPVVTYLLLGSMVTRLG
ncbi:MAG TPA: hypothetical protein PLI52_01210, partial [Prochlorococcaceae cyanobacterium AMR_MDS_5431]|nr:hypothetical protein [Prochlorococcaceae cyanobacterium AMR_MDS_5431]